MAQYSFKGTADMSAHDAALKKSAEEVRAYQTTVENAANSVENFTDAERVSTKELLNQLSQLESVGRKSSDFQRQLGQVTKQIQDLTVCYTKLTDEEKSSPLGQATAQRIAELTDIAQEYKDTLDGVREQMGGSAPDISKWDMAAEAIHAVTDSIGAYVAISEFNETQQEKLIQTLTMLSRIEAIGNAVVSAGTTFRNVFAQVEKVRAIQLKAATAATVLQTKATGQATIAQRAFNLVAKANPYVLLATVLITAAVAVGTFVKKMSDAREEQERANEEAERTAEKMEKIGDSVGDVVGDYKVLQAQWKQLSTEQEKAKWVEENKSKFEQLGLSVTSVADAEKVLVEQTGAVVKALAARAKAEAAMEMYKESIKEDIKNDLNPTAENGRVVTNTKNAGAEVTQGNIKDAGLRKGIDYKTSITTMNTAAGAISLTVHQLTEEGAKRWNEYRQSVADNLKAASSETEKWLGKVEETYKEAADAQKELKNVGVKTVDPKGGSTSTTPTVSKEDLTVLQTMQNELSALKKQQENIHPLEINTEEGKRRIVELAKLIAEKEKQISDYKIAVGIDKQKVKEVVKVKGTLERLREELKQYEDQLIQLNFDEPGAEAQLEDIKKKVAATKAEIEKTEIKLGITTPEVAPPTGSIADLENQLSLKQQSFKVAIDPQSRKQILDDIDILQARIEKMSSPLTLGQQFQKAADDIDGLISPVRGIADAWSSFNDACEDGNVLTVFSALTDSILTTISAFGGIIEMIDAFKVASQANQQIQNANSQQQIANTQAEIATSTAKTAANSGEAITEATKSGAKLPFPANIAAIAAGVAAVIAALAMVSKFAGGGIVNGRTTVGDMNLARVNGGEMILNNRQQGNLFKLLNGTVGAGQSAPTGNVVFKIKGDTLYGVLKNHTKISNKSGKNISL